MKQVTSRIFRAAVLGVGFAVAGAGVAVATPVDSMAPTTRQAPQQSTGLMADETTGAERTASGRDQSRAGSGQECGGCHHDKGKHHKGKHHKGKHHKGKHHKGHKGHHKGKHHHGHKGEHHQGKHHHGHKGEHHNARHHDQHQGGHHGSPYADQGRDQRAAESRDTAHRAGHSDSGSAPRMNAPMSPAQGQAAPMSPAQGQAAPARSAQGQAGSPRTLPAQDSRTQGMGGMLGRLFGGLSL
ncbi:hypothetical protein DMH02_018680 [Streptomyces sp. WAC 00631]|uniref:hypothetical protein n=1 Tax=unclassified Streptomyces TaxID=2593676 RepID=UPI000F783A85|nr:MULTISPECIES: hypothetical protein [unclassified Streptomyces]MCC5035182.1 hypothetical protein [Streptomyces sp. WAC 00631]MCC9739773.1 hypothetical protein [Streptomyces sp. MNU89]